MEEREKEARKGEGVWAESGEREGRQKPGRAGKERRGKWEEGEKARRGKRQTNWQTDRNRQNESGKVKKDVEPQSRLK